MASRSAVRPAADAARIVTSPARQPAIAATVRRTPKSTLRWRMWSMFGPGVPESRNTAMTNSHQVWRVIALPSAIGYFRNGPMRPGGSALGRQHRQDQRDNRDRAALEQDALLHQLLR